MCSLSFENNTLAIAAKHYRETGIKDFLSFPFLLDVFTFSHIFFQDGSLTSRLDKPGSTLIFYQPSDYISFLKVSFL